MPRATVNRDSTDKILLKTCPPDGFVVLRRLSYGEYLARQEMSMQMRLVGEGGKGSQSNMDLALLQRKTTEFEFKSCIVDHNLEDENGQPLDFRQSTTIDKLDPKIGQEISQHVSDLIQFEDDLKN